MKKLLEFDIMTTCTVCKGSGKCTRCNGTGIIYVGFLSKREQLCNKCNGIGQCKKCNGSGEISTLTRKVTKVRCPKCGSLIQIESEERPFQTECKCGLTIILKK
jgi:DnaJ-class molecular chaperone